MITRLWALGARLYPDSVLNPHRWIARIVIMVTAWLALLVIGAGLLARMGQGTRVPPWSELLPALAVVQAVAVGMILTMLWPPAVRGRGVEVGRELRVATWRWIAFPGSGAIPIALLLTFLEAGRPPLGYLAVPLLLQAFGSLGLRAERLAWSDQGVVRIGLFGGRQSVSWHEVTWMYGALAGARLGTASGKWVAIPGMMLEGWPELAAELLKRVPSEAIDASPGAREALEIVASRFRPS